MSNLKSTFKTTSSNATLKSTFKTTSSNAILKSTFPTSNTGFSMFSKLPTTETLYADNTGLRDSKNIISLTHFVKIMQAFPVSEFQQSRLAMLCTAYNALTGEQQRAQDEAHLSAEDDWAVFTDEHGYAIVQHDPTYTEFKILGFDGVQMISRTML